MDRQEVTERVQKMMRESGAHLKGHFLLTSGNHSGDYIQCAMLLRFPAFAAYAGEALAEKVAKYSPEIIVSPAMGGIIIGHEVARALDIPFIFCERQDGAMTLKRFPMPAGKRVVVIEDVITTGVSGGEAGKVLSAGGADWVGTGAILDRSEGRSCLPGAPESLWETAFPFWSPDQCPLCTAGIPLVKPGSRPLKR